MKRNCAKSQSYSVIQAEAAINLGARLKPDMVKNSPPPPAIVCVWSRQFLDVS